MSLACKHKQYEALGFCPICEHNRAMTKIKSQLTKQDYIGSAPTVFVGRVGYPHLNVGIMAPPIIDEQAWMLDDPRYWGKHNFSIPQMINVRSELVNSRFSIDIKGKNKWLDISREVAMSSKPVEVDINLDKKPDFKMSFHGYSAPSGPKAGLKKVTLASNPKIDKKVDYVVSDKDFKANLAIDYLYKHGYDENFISRLLSIGNLGAKADRKLVPTRWSITATDDALGKKIETTIKNYEQLGYFVYFGGYLGNYYLILTFPDVWSYELFEASIPNPGEKLNYATDYEFYNGRKDYAFATTGGYYAARLPILEKLLKIRKQASILCLRFITKEYAVPLGVWVVREATRKAMQEKPVEFSSKELMILYAINLTKRKFGCDIVPMLKDSKLVRKINSQTKLRDYGFKF